MPKPTEQAASTGGRQVPRKEYREIHNGMGVCEEARKSKVTNPETMAHLKAFEPTVDGKRPVCLDGVRQMVSEQ